jgi:hypothetical protein
MKLDDNCRRISQLLVRWEEVRKELTVHFENRETEKTHIPMEEGIIIFLNLLFFTNDREWNEEDSTMMELQWKPVNVLERITFIKKRPNLFHSFIQLSELITEQEKQFNKKMAIKKMTKQ